MKRTRVLEVGGYSILFIDYSQLDEDTPEGLEIARQAIEANLAALEEWSRPYLLAIYDATGLKFKAKIKDEFKRVSEKVELMGISKGSAVLGGTRATRVLGKVFRPDMYFARNLEDAQRWLIDRMKSSQPSPG